jgi:hypothetical protein
MATVTAVERDGQMPECSEIGSMLSAAGDGELEPRDLREVANHLERCASCTGALSDYSKIGRELRAIAVMPSLDKFTKSVLDLIGKLIIIVIVAAAIHSITNLTSVMKIARPLPETVASRPPAPASVVGTPSLVDVQVDSAFVAGAASGSFIHTNGHTQSGKMIVFSLPGGKTLHVQPRAIDGGMIAMEVVLFDGKRPTMTANLNLESGDTFAVGGEKYGAGTLLIRICPTTASNDAARARQAS